MGDWCIYAHAMPGITNRKRHSQDGFQGKHLLLYSLPCALTSNFLLFPVPQAGHKALCTYPSWCANTMAMFSSPQLFISTDWLFAQGMGLGVGREPSSESLQFKIKGFWAGGHWTRPNSAFEALGKFYFKAGSVLHNALPDDHCIYSREA